VLRIRLQIRAEIALRPLAVEKIEGLWPRCKTRERRDLSSYSWQHSPISNRGMIALPGENSCADSTSNSSISSRSPQCGLASHPPVNFSWERMRSAMGVLRDGTRSLYFLACPNLKSLFRDSKGKVSHQGISPAKV